MRSLLTSAMAVALSLLAALSLLGGCVCATADTCCGDMADQQDVELVCVCVCHLVTPNETRPSLDQTVTRPTIVAWAPSDLIVPEDPFLGTDAPPLILAS